ncbi:hypothetical protein K530_53345 [Streptomyces noursei CCRC 11814]|uniref:Uncharacterized protein n=1 Tax=Streptomyces noursei TaxID=1971 RepID=A0A401QTL2_STRNR|nr:hypothetical protein K530_53345 [Streptomyces noursei CCRC 11814]GCB88734.1 hypothetical protein SALB_01407 [Streptomyces noursei]
MARASGEVSCTTFARELAPWIELLNRLALVSSYVSSSASSKSTPAPGCGLVPSVVTEKGPAPLSAKPKRTTSDM